MDKKWWEPDQAKTKRPSNRAHKALIKKKLNSCDPLRIEYHLQRRNTRVLSHD